MSKEWEIYKWQVIKTQQKIKKNQDHLGFLFKQCTCEETIHKEDYYSETVIYDQCVICGKHHNEWVKHGTFFE